MALSKNKIKYIQSLKDKKGRAEQSTFVAEGNKLVTELLSCLKCQLLVATKEYLDEYPNINAEEIVEVSETELSKASFVKTPQQVLGVFYQPKYISEDPIDEQLNLVLDGIQDPGNMGTIMRLADWYGIKNIFCSKDTVDIYNPKTIQATMGAIARVKVHYTDLVPFLSESKNIPIYGTFLDGEDMYEKTLSSHGFIVMGNEGNGIRPEIEKYISDKIYIPSYPKDSQSSESLNVAIATAIVCTEFRRRSFT